MSTKHTPEPWVASCRSISYSGGDWPEDEFLQWEVDGPRVPLGRGQFFQADALLIAAAPKLLAAAQKALAECCDLAETDAGRALEDAIARATGEQQ